MKKLIALLSLVLAIVGLPGLALAATPDLKALQKAVDTAQQNLDAAQAEYNNGGLYGYLESQGDSTSLGYLTNCKYNSYNKRGDPKDATSPDNVRKALTALKEVNDKRISVGLKPLKVTNGLMAMAAADANYSDTFLGHAQQFSVGENVAWNYGSGAVDQWYSEKSTFDALAKQIDGTTGLTGAAAYSYYKEHYNEMSQQYQNIGHYINLISPNYTIAGMGACTRGTMYGWTTFANVFDWTVGSDAKQTEYDLDAWANSFNAYVKTTEDKVSAAQAAYDKAKADLDAATPVTMWRLYNPNSGEHFYTASDSERADVIDAGWNDEGVGWRAPKGGNPVYRLYNKNGGEHHYTLSASERDSLVQAGWSYEGIGWYSDRDKSVPLYREYNPNQFACNHNYTPSKTEHDHLVSLGWHDEGIGWYGI